MDRLLHPALNGKPVAWFAPTYKYLTPVWHETVSRVKDITARLNQQERLIMLTTGGSIEMWTLDTPDAGRSRAYATAIVDEAAIVPDLEDAWQEGIRPALSDYQGNAWFLSTPKGIANYFHSLYQRGVNGDSEWRSWQMPTSTNPFIEQAEIEAARDDLSELAFAQEYLAQFVTWTGAVFRKIMDAVSDGRKPSGKPAVIGVDWGRSGDYTVFATLSDAGELLELDRFRGIEYALQRARLAALYERCGKPLIIAEANAMGQPVIEQLARDGLKVQSFVTTNASKAEAVESLALAFERGEIRIPNDPVLIGELQAFEAKPLPSGMMRYSAPDDGHDDTVMALAIGWTGIVGYHKRRTDSGLIRQLMNMNVNDLSAPCPYRL